MAIEISTLQYELLPNILFDGNGMNLNFENKLDLLFKHRVKQDCN